MTPTPTPDERAAAISALGANGAASIVSNSRFLTHVHEFICPSEPDLITLGRFSVFAGGGITDCPDWQVLLPQLVNEKLARAVPEHRPESAPMLTVLNPRRAFFPLGDPNASPFQIAWEHRYLKLAAALSMWFPKDSEGPISLFETGRWLLSAKPFFLGIEPGYRRATAARSSSVGQ